MMQMTKQQWEVWIGAKKIDPDVAKFLQGLQKENEKLSRKVAKLENKGVID